MMNTALSTVVFDGAGNQYQVVYPSSPVYNETNLRMSSPDQRTLQLIPHRLFVGGFPATTSEAEIRAAFERFGHVRESKVIRSADGASKCYGFVTFDTEDEAKAVMERAEREKVELNGRRLNLGPALRRTIHGPRIPQEYTWATPTGQLITVGGYSGYSVAYPQSPYFVLSPAQTPSLVCSPLTSSAQPVFAFPAKTSGAQATEIPTATAESVGQIDVKNTFGFTTPRNQPTNANSLEFYSTPQALNNLCVSSNAQQFPPAQPLTPVTPSVMCPYPSSVHYTQCTAQSDNRGQCAQSENRAQYAQVANRDRYAQGNPSLSGLPYLLSSNTVNNNQQAVPATAHVNNHMVQQAIPRNVQRKFNNTTGWQETGPAEMMTSPRGSTSSLNSPIPQRNLMNRSRAERGDLHR